MRISDWSSDVCSSDLPATSAQREVWVAQNVDPSSPVYNIGLVVEVDGTIDVERAAAAIKATVGRVEALFVHFRVDADNQLIQVPIPDARWDRSEEHTSELQSLIRISYAVFFCTKKN